MENKYDYDLKGKDGVSVETINLVNITTQLNGITEIVNGLGGGGLSEAQLKQINEKIKSVTDNLEKLKNDVDKYIDEQELADRLKDIKDTLNNTISKNDFTDKVNQITQSLSTIQGEINKLKNNGGGGGSADLSEYAKKSEVENIVTTKLTDKLSEIEATWKNEIVTSVKNDIKTQLATLKSEIEQSVDNKINNINVDTKIEDKITEKLGDYVLKSTYNSDKDTFLTTNKLQHYTEDINTTGNLTVGDITNDEKGITTGKLKTNNISVSSDLKVFSFDPDSGKLTIGESRLSGGIEINGNPVTINGKNVITDTSQFVTLSGDNTFTGANKFTNSVNLSKDLQYKDKEIIKDNSDLLNIGNTAYDINLISKTNTIKVNGQDFSIDTSNFVTKSDFNTEISKINTLNNKFTDLDNKVITLNSNITGIESKIKTNSESITNLSDKVTPLETSINSISPKVSILETNYTSLSDKVTGLEIAKNNYIVKSEFKDYFQVLTEDEYNALPQKDENKIYLIKES